MILAAINLYTIYKIAAAVRVEISNYGTCTIVWRFGNRANDISVWHDILLILVHHESNIE